MYTILNFVFAVDGVHPSTNTQSSYLLPRYSVIWGDMDPVINKNLVNTWLDEYQCVSDLFHVRGDSSDDGLNVRLSTESILEIETFELENVVADDHEIDPAFEGKYGAQDLVVITTFDDFSCALFEWLSSSNSGVHCLLHSPSSLSEYCEHHTVPTLTTTIASAPPPQQKRNLIADDIEHNWLIRSQQSLVRTGHQLSEDLHTHPKDFVAVDTIDPKQSYALKSIDHVRKMDGEGSWLSDASNLMYDHFIGKKKKSAHDEDNEGNWYHRRSLIVSEDNIKKETEAAVEEDTKSMLFISSLPLHDWAAMANVSSMFGVVFSAIPWWVIAVMLSCTILAAIAACYAMQKQKRAFVHRQLKGEFDETFIPQPCCDCSCMEAEQRSIEIGVVY